ncbi:MAG: 3'-5' exoribonuclease YhaM family protein [Candidatus Sumerlaeaceae bacterium]
MARKYIRIADLQSGTKVEAVFLLHNYQQRPKKDGNNFVTMALKDASGKITGVMWDNFAGLTSGSIKENDFVEVSGEVLTYNNQLQFKVSKLVKVSDSEVDAAFFLPVCPIPVAELEKELLERIEQIADTDYKALVKSVFDQPMFMERFRRAPSAVTMHQAYLGGLLEHTLCVVRNALKMSDNYPQANRSLLIAGGLLHDIGKIVEFTYEKKIAYSDAGRLLGHISMGNAMVECHCARLEFPMAKKVLLQHMILSHHGLMEYGSPKCPATLEALILHHADLLDAQLSNFMEFAQNAARTGSRWEYNNMFERHMFGATEIMDDGCDLMREVAHEPPRVEQRRHSPAEAMATAVSSNELMETLVS